MLTGAVQYEMNDGQILFILIFSFTNLMSVDNNRSGQALQQLSQKSTAAEGTAKFTHKKQITRKTQDEE